MAEHKGFFLYLDQHKPLSKLSLEQKGELLEAMFAFNAGEEFVFSDPVVEIVFGFFEQSFMRDRSRYEDKCAKMKENAQKKQLQAKAANCKQLHAMASKRIQQQEQEQEQEQEKEKTESIIAPNPSGFRAESGTLVCDKSTAKERAEQKQPPPRDDLTAYYLPVKSEGMSEVAYLKAENWQTWERIYGGEFCLEQLRRAYKWSLDSPEKAKTAKGIHKFFGSWLEREQNTRGSARASPQRYPPAQPDDSITRTMTAAANVLQRRRERENANA